jgi:apolipoprotein D and lipocalin family protein
MRMTIKTCSLLVTLLIMLPIHQKGVIAQVPIENTRPGVVDSVDLPRYCGLWYEIARIPNTFQTKCAGNVTAFYTQRPDGKIDVTNRCIGKQGKQYEAKGIARVIDHTSNAKLQVSFVRILGINLFWGDYWVIGLDPNYQWAIIGHPKRSYGWILSRTPTITGEVQSNIEAILRQNGYDPTQFVSTHQSHSH